MSMKYYVDIFSQIVRVPGAQILTIGGSGGGGQTDFTFKMFLGVPVSRIRMFAIEILLVGVLFGAILCPSPIFQLRRCQIIENHVIHSYVQISAFFLSAFVNLVSLKF